MKYYIQVSEPWDFKSPDGSNIINGILEIKSANYAFFKTNYEIEVNETKGKVLVLQPRFENETFKSSLQNDFIMVNVGILTNINDINLSFNNVNDKAIFVIVGSLRKQ